VIPESSGLRERFLKDRPGGETDMKCHTPDCIGEPHDGTISHSVIYRERTLVLHGVPADICPECGDAVLHEETGLPLRQVAAG
jgi:YgiT-type zinc finger domain-containing protein